MKTDERVSLGPGLQRNNLHSVRQICIKLEPRLLGPFACLTIHAAMATTIYHHLQGGPARWSPN